MKPNTTDTEVDAMNERNIEILKAFQESEEGQPMLNGIRKWLEGRTITGVDFTVHEDGILTTLRLDNGEYFCFLDNELRLEVLEEQFSRLFAELTGKFSSG